MLLPKNEQARKKKNKVHIETITDKNPKASFGVLTLRFAGLFNFPIPVRFAFGIGVSQIKKGKLF
jgi:hypothetical protein